MKILVTGGRDYNDYGVVCQTLDELRLNMNKEGIDIELIQGGANGADRLARIWANVNCISCTTYPANWITYGKKAGILRNRQMLTEEKPDLVVAFPGGRGTAHMVRIATAANVPVQHVALLASV